MRLLCATPLCVTAPSWSTPRVPLRSRRLPGAAEREVRTVSEDGAITWRPCCALRPLKVPLSSFLSRPPPLGRMKRDLLALLRPLASLSPSPFLTFLSDFWPQRSACPGRVTCEPNAGRRWLALCLVNCISCVRLCLRNKCWSNKPFVRPAARRRVEPSPGQRAECVRVWVYTQRQRSEEEAQGRPVGFIRYFHECKQKQTKIKWLGTITPT